MVVLQRTTFVTLLILLVVAAVLGFRHGRSPVDHLARAPHRLWTRVFAHRVPTQTKAPALRPAEQAAARALAARLEALIVWSSNRSGNHQLYLLDPRRPSLRRLTHHPHVDSFPRFSPDGRRVAFMRSQRPGVSLRDEQAWDIYLINVDGRGERLLARQGYGPTWSPDGGAVVFYRGDRTIAVRLETGQETVLLDADAAMPGAHVAGGTLAPDGQRLAFTVRGPFDGVAVYDLGHRQMIPMTTQQACQIVWAPDGQHLAWIETGGNGGTRVMTGQADGHERRVLIDLLGANSHEYFPKFSNDGRWLIWGATAEGHEQDQADYEIFLWEVGTPWQQAMRLTYDPGNDQWPDLWVRPPR